MILAKQNFSIELNEDTKQLKLQKKELERLKKLLEEFPEQYLLYGKTQLTRKNKENRYI